MMLQCKCGKLPNDCGFFHNQYDCDGEPKRLVPRMDDCQGEFLLSPVFAERVKWMETESRFAVECPDLDQEKPHCPRNEGEPCHSRHCSDYRDCYLKVRQVEEEILTTTFGPIEQLLPNPKQRYGDLKVPGALVPASAVIYMGEAFAEGARKYGPYNWRDKAVESMTYLNAIWRHWAAVIDGEWIDPESGKPHLALLMASAAIIIDCYEQGNLIDNRPTPGNAGQMLRDRTKKLVDETPCTG